MKFVFAITFALAASACSTIEIAPNLRSSPTEQHPLTNTSWFLREAPSVTIEFAADNTVSGWTGCNSYSRSYKARDNEIDFFDLQRTYTACTTKYAILTENLLLAVTSGRTLWIIKGSELRLTAAHSQRTLRLWKNE